MNRRNMLILVALLSLLILLPACTQAIADSFIRGFTLALSAGHPPKPKPPLPQIMVTDIGGPGQNRFAIRAKALGPPYPQTVQVKWQADYSNRVESSNVTQDYLMYHFTREAGWELPVDPDTGETPTVYVQYTNLWDPNVTLVDEFAVCDREKWSAAVITRPQGDNAQATQAGTPLVEAQSAQPSSAQDDNYYLWQLFQHIWPTSAMTMTASLCQEHMNLLQSENTFFALRFPVSPTLPYTAPYHLPLLTGPITDTYAPKLILKYSSHPYTTVLTVPLEIRSGYLGFLVNKMPQAPGERWIAMGVVTTPTVDCSSVPTMTNWMYEAELWLDLGGTREAGMGATLPFYSCYKGQTLASFVGLTSYQDWGITCLGPQPIFLEDVPRIELAGTHTGWITPTQTITFYHPIRNWTGITRTVTITYTSTPTLPWQLYTAFEADPNTLVPLTSTIELPSSFWKIRPLWAKVTVPEDASAGAATLIITATDVTSPTLSTWTSDLVWVGEWVAPPPPPWEKYKVYLPLVIR